MWHCNVDLKMVVFDQFVTLMYLKRIEYLSIERDSGRLHVLLKIVSAEVMIYGEDFTQ